MYKNAQTLAKFVMHREDAHFSGSGIKEANRESINTFIFNNGPEQNVVIDEVTYKMPEHCILPLVSNQHFIFEHPQSVTAWRFNREFYCIVDHDAEVGCVGFLFYGIKHPMFIRLNEAERKEMAYLEKAFSNELLVNDHFQGEMLRALLKRVIITTTRIAKKQTDSYQSFSDDRMDLVRKFALLVEGHFKEHHDVAFYASALNKSPKTISNVFLLLKQTAPSMIIRNRLILEAKRYLHYTDKTGKEIAYELGFESPAHFSRFFKRYTGLSVSDFKIKS